MGKLIGAVIAGYIAIVIAMFALMTVAWVILGADGAFLPGSFEVTWEWIVVMIVAGFVAAYCGGRVAARIARDTKAVLGLIGVVVVLGAAMAIPVLTSDPALLDVIRPDDLPMFDAMNKGQQPGWVALVNPFIGAIGVWMGGLGRTQPTA